LTAHAPVCFSDVSPRVSARKRQSCQLCSTTYLSVYEVVQVLFWQLRLDAARTFQACVFSVFSARASLGLTPHMHSPTMFDTLLPRPDKSLNDWHTHAKVFGQGGNICSQQNRRQGRTRHVEEGTRYRLVRHFSVRIHAYVVGILPSKTSQIFATVHLYTLAH